MLRQKGVDETKEYRTGGYICHKEKNGVGPHGGDDDEHDVTCSDANGERSDEQLGRDRVSSWKRYSWSRWPTVWSCVFGSSNDRPLTRRTKHLHVTRLTVLEFKSGAYNTVQAYLKHGLQIGPMRRHTLHSLFLVPSLVFVSLHAVFFPNLSPSLSWYKYFNCITFV